MQVPSIVLRGNACYKDAKIILDILNSVSRMEQKCFAMTHFANCMCLEEFCSPQR